MKIKVISKKTKSKQPKYMLSNEITNDLLFKVNKNVLAIMAAANYSNLGWEKGGEMRSYDDCLFALQLLMSKGNIPLTKTYIRNPRAYLSTFKTVQVGSIKLKFWIGKVCYMNSSDGEKFSLKMKQLGTDKECSVTKYKFDQGKTVITVSIASRSKMIATENVAKLIEEKKQTVIDRAINDALCA
jgi:hypothetical protein